jgi:hypothetical protein
MSEHLVQFQSLTQQLDTLVKAIHECRDPKERKELLRRMRLMLDEVDSIAFSPLKLDKSGTARSPIK